LSIPNGGPALAAFTLIGIVVVATILLNLLDFGRAD
jgi:hypothetical protein